MDGALHKRKRMNKISKIAFSRKMFKVLFILENAAAELSVAGYSLTLNTEY